MAAPPELVPAPEPRLARLGPALAALTTFAVHAACWGRYGLFRDEMYYLVCGQRLSAGYVDQPPGIAVVARLAYSLFGTWVPGLRLFSWIAGAATVYLVGRLAARIARGSATAATLAAVAASSCLLLLGAPQHLSLNAFEPLLVLAVVHVLLRLTEGGDERLWVAAGGLAGLAVLMKYTAAPLCLAARRRHRHIRTARALHVVGACRRDRRRARRPAQLPLAGDARVPVPGDGPRRGDVEEHAHHPAPVPRRPALRGEQRRTCSSRRCGSAA